MASSTKFLVFYIQAQEEINAGSPKPAQSHVTVTVREVGGTASGEQSTLLRLEEEFVGTCKIDNSTSQAQCQVLITSGNLTRELTTQSGDPWTVDAQNAPTVSYWRLDNNQDGDLAMCEETSLEELVQSSFTTEFFKRLVLSARGDLAIYILEYLQSTMEDILAEETPDASPVTYPLRRLLVRLSVDSGLLPPSLFLSNVNCNETEPVGVGGNADVFKGFHAGGSVALKRLRVFVNNQHSQNYQSFVREALVWRNLRHQHVLPFLGVDQKTFKSYLCMVSPWLPFGDINNCMNILEGRGEIIPHLRWVTEIADGMVYLHRERVVHADLRGGNVLIDEKLRVRLSDFGLAQFADSTTISRGTEVGGTLRWMAPELVVDSKKADYASDVYSFGCVCLEVYTQCRPFPSLNDAQVIVQVMRGAHPPRVPMKSGNEIPADMWELIGSCLSFSALDRPTMVQLSSSLSELSRPKVDAEVASVMSNGEGTKGGSIPAMVRHGSLFDDEEPEAMELVKSAFGSRLHKGLLLSARGVLADTLMCAMQRILDAHTDQPYVQRPNYFAFVRCLLLELSTETHLLPSSLSITDVANVRPGGSTRLSFIYSGVYQGQKVALKRIRVSQSPFQRNILKALCRETIVWRQLKHPNILPLFGITEIALKRGSHFCLVSPWATKGNVIACFWEFLKLSMVERAKILERWISEVASALEYLHQERIIHADIRSGNILMTEDMRAQLAHFNVTFFQDELIYDPAASQKQFGSEYPSWMAPEVLLSGSHPTFANDVYAFGCLCVELFTGGKIFPDTHYHTSAASYLAAQPDRRLPRPAGEKRTVIMSDEMWALVERCWEPVETRPSMRGVVLELKKIRGE